MVASTLTAQDIAGSATRNTKPRVRSLAPLGFAVEPASRFGLLDGVWTEVYFAATRMSSPFFFSTDREYFASDCST